MTITLLPHDIVIFRKFTIVISYAGDREWHFDTKVTFREFTIAITQILSVNLRPPGVGKINYKMNVTG